jgi:signal transduction histidine kinase
LQNSGISLEKSAATILIVDDEKINVALFSAQLKDSYSSTIGAYSGEEALRIVEAQPPDLILLDIMMPGMSGFEVTSKLKGSSSTSNIPIIVISALNDRDSCIRALECGAEEFLSKPVQKAELLMRVRNLLKLKKAQDFLAAQSSRLEKQIAADDLRLSELQEKLFQSEKLASIGQLAAGIAHEINNPIGFVKSNLNRLSDYVQRIDEVLQCYEAVEPLLPREAEAALAIREIKARTDLALIRAEVPDLIAESQDGVSRVGKIVHDLKDFSRADGHWQWEMANLHRCMDSAVNIAGSAIEYRGDVVKNYGAIPPVECVPTQLGQVFLNLLVNAAQAIGDAPRRGSITIRSGCRDDQHVWVEIADNGCGMKADEVNRIFDPFYTTKDVGVGTGLGLSISYGIVMRHGGSIEVVSTPGQGSSFRIVLPVRRDVPSTAANG